MPQGVGVQVPPRAPMRIRDLIAKGNRMERDSRAAEVAQVSQLAIPTISGKLETCPTSAKAIETKRDRTDDDQQACYAPKQVTRRNFT